LQFYEAALKFAMEASNDAHTCLPSLILVENMTRDEDDEDEEHEQLTSSQHYSQASKVKHRASTTLTSLMPSPQLAQEFLAAHDNGNPLRNRFKNVLCIQIPWFRKKDIANKVAEYQVILSITMPTASYILMTAI
jgi:hypothetical protein